MHNIRIAAASVNQTPLDWQGNRHRLEATIGSARDAGAQLLCLPELAITGYGCEDMFFSVGVQQAALRQLGELLPHTKG
ncbi:MAG: nitrilase-related carbon-nitrogen hydrolase, partial [Aeoliella sp.]